MSHARVIKRKMPNMMMHLANPHSRLGQVIIAFGGEGSPGRRWPMLCLLGRVPWPT
jgi:hypothetical protein